MQYSISVTKTLFRGEGLTNQKILFKMIKSLKYTWYSENLLSRGCFAQTRSTPTSGPPKVSARTPANRSYHFRGVKLKSCIKKIHHNLYISKQANVKIKHADTEGASHKKFGTDARVQ